jgi:cation transport ATPase
MRPPHGLTVGDRQAITRRLCSDPLDIPTALRIGRGTLRKMRQNLGWAIGYNAIALSHRA